ncbi:MAPEG family protein [Pacificimonas sp. WHA3]|uniref:MAPEG family protein n=1 Tax=Pacificimonas pallii TaxID=2827236 RepID=A0ABS6SHZ0_9SPHN|nr:MAPEG family protein [Pacificimonas pallii]MBV7257477.1 MAPEG family protein [Pacificimonas pallii]
MPEISTHAASMLHAIIAMGALTLVMFIWLYATRLPAMSAAKIDPQDAAHPGSYTLPSKAARVADNYNHLFEAPVMFYAIVIAIVLLGLADQIHVWCAWAYVGLRVVHSLVQATINVVVLRFAIFALSWIALGALIARAALAIL